MRDGGGRSLRFDAARAMGTNFERILHDSPPPTSPLLVVSVSGAANRFLVIGGAVRVEKVLGVGGPFDRLTLPRRHVAPHRAGQHGHGARCGGGRVSATE